MLVHVRGWVCGLRSYSAQIPGIINNNGEDKIASRNTDEKGVEAMESNSGGNVRPLFRLAAWEEEKRLAMGAGEVK